MEVTPTSQGLGFSTDFAHGEAYLTVQGADGVIHSATISAGAPLQTEFAKALPDGEYSWELLLVEPVDDEARRALAALRRGDATPERPTVASHRFTGSFRLDGGAAVEPQGGSQSERDLPTKDIVQNDDVIIDGSLCVGFNCVDGENFG
ncbi:MAG: hypothetical protein AAFX50_01485, partial [Acidobacteriota bacterium]